MLSFWERRNRELLDIKRKKDAPISKPPEAEKRKKFELLRIYYNPTQQNFVKCSISSDLLGCLAYLIRQREEMGFWCVRGALALAAEIKDQEKDERKSR